MRRIHGTCVLLSGFGVLLRGPSGSGKSDLALRLIDGGARLVADDQVELVPSGRRLLAQAPESLRGLIEIRGIGIQRMEAAGPSPLGLVVDLCAEEERLPEMETADLQGFAIRRLALPAFHASTPAKLRFAAARLAEGALAPVPVPP
jgi:serine kinase of HPr protein (carbohydrate metabolism regulator)